MKAAGVVTYWSVPPKRNLTGIRVSQLWKSRPVEEMPRSTLNLSSLALLVAVRVP